MGCKKSCALSAAGVASTYRFEALESHLKKAQENRRVDGALQEASCSSRCDNAFCKGTLVEMCVDFVQGELASAQVVSVCKHVFTNAFHKTVASSSPVVAEQDKVAGWYYHVLSSIQQFVKAQKNGENDACDQIFMFHKLGKEGQFISAYPSSPSVPEIIRRVLKLELGLEIK